MAKTHPHSGDHAELYESWLEPNGLIGWMPENATITVDSAAGTITWPKFRHNSPGAPWDGVATKSDYWTDAELQERGSEQDGLIVDETTVPLVAPVTERVRELANATGVTLVEK